jgi:curved DNA-binding protein CbpA
MISESTDHYRVLQVDPRADVEVIQAAYRVLARRFHPDHSGDDGMMKRLNAAWEVLADSGRRADYDRDRSSGAAGQASAPIATGSPRRPVADHAGPPTGRAFGTVLTYGRYDGWSLGQIALVDPEFLEWLASVPGGRYLRPEIEAILLEVQGPLTIDGRWRAAGSNAHRFKASGARIG